MKLRPCLPFAVFATKPPPEATSGRHLGDLHAWLARGARSSDILVRLTPQPPSCQDDTSGARSWLGSYKPAPSRQGPMVRIHLPPAARLLRTYFPRQKKGGLETMASQRGTDGSNPAPSRSESVANHRGCRAAG